MIANIRRCEWFGMDFEACGNCAHFENDTDVCDDYCPYCNKMHTMEPEYTKECWHPNFWLTKFSSIIDGSDESYDAAQQAYGKAISNYL